MYRCKYCKQRIVKINYALGEEWVHQHEGASFQDGIHTYCHLTSAEPEEDCTNPECPKAGKCGGECLKQFDIKVEIDQDLPSDVILLKNPDGTVVGTFVKVNSDIPLGEIPLYTFTGKIVKLVKEVNDVKETPKSSTERQPLNTIPGIDPVKMCCGHRKSEHKGPTCPDGLTPCCICFLRFQKEDLFVDVAGHIWDECKKCKSAAISVIQPVNQTGENQ